MAALGGIGVIVALIAQRVSARRHHRRRGARHRRSMAARSGGWHHRRRRKRASASSWRRISGSGIALSGIGGLAHQRSAATRIIARGSGIAHQQLSGGGEILGIARRALLGGVMAAAWRIAHRSSRHRGGGGV